MPNNKDHTKAGSSSMGSTTDREFEHQGQDSSSGKDKPGKQGGSFGKSSGNMEDDDMTTAGGRKGNFSDKDRDDESQWSPGSTQSSDR